MYRLLSIYLVIRGYTSDTGIFIRYFSSWF